MSSKNVGFSKEQFVGKKDGKLEDKYTIVKEIGSGGYSRCLEVKNKTTGLLFACKELEKALLHGSAFSSVLCAKMMKRAMGVYIRSFRVFSERQSGLLSRP